MRICANCGVELAEGEQFCSICDAPVELLQAPEDTKDEAEQVAPADELEPENEEAVPDEPAVVDEPETAAEEPAPQKPNMPIPQERRASSGERAMGALAYVFFIIPLIIGKGEFVKYHTNQSAVIFLGFVSSVAIAVIPYVGVALGILGAAFNLLCSIAGIACALGGKKIILPIIGKFIILK